jgi:hypothetical protein
MKEIALSGKRGQGLFTKVDDEDYDYLKQFSWSLSPKGYAQAYIPTKFQSEYNHTSMQMQRMLMLNSITEESQMVDHINRDKLDNRRENLRLCNMSESNCNRGNINFKRKQEITSNYKGVWWDKTKWRAAVTVNNKKIYLGRFDNEQDAAIAYNEAAKKYFGEYAYLNEL